MVKPICYLQTDSRWKNANYSAKGERKTIGSSGCGPTAAAMAIATLKDKSVTPVTTAEWSMAHGYKAFNQGTYYTYFVPQMAAYGITCKKLNASNLYGKSSSTAHTEALNALKRDDWVIACMGKGNWTSSGHFILLYGYENGYVYINDPASTKASRIKNTWALFAKQVKYMWTITVPDSFKKAPSSANPSYTKTQFIKDVQKAIGAKVDGIAGAETLSKTITVSRTINSRHPVVKPLQTYLNVQGYDCGAVDGIAGTKFDASLKAYQKNLVGMRYPDGEATKSGNTWKCLLGMR
jgi:peptidoglycan hydrolase-like protein with peptidoglycan-binding domain